MNFGTTPKWIFRQQHKVSSQDQKIQNEETRSKEAHSEILSTVCEKNQEQNMEGIGESQN